MASKPVGLGLCERRGGLVHEDDLGVARQRARDRHDLSLRDWQTPQRRVEVELHAELGQQARAVPRMAR